jgi:hypothetical protein
MLSSITGSVLVSVTKGPCGPMETIISLDRWLVVVMAIVWYPYEYFLSVMGICPLPFLAHL